MKILQVVHGFPPENVAGTEVYTHNLSQALSKHHDVSVFYRTADLSKEEYKLSFFEREGLRLFSINNTFGNYDSFESTYRDKRVAEKFSEILDKIKPDIVHIQHLLYLSAGIVEEAEKRNIPVIFTLHDYWLLCPQGQLFRAGRAICDGERTAECMNCVLYQLGIRKNISRVYAILRKFTPGWFFQMAKAFYLRYAKSVYLTDSRTEEFLQDRINFMKRLCSEVDFFIAPSEFIKEKFIKFGIPGQKIKRIPYGFDLARIRSVPKTPSSVLRFGFIGNLMPAKGAHVLIKSFSAIQTDKAELKIYGKAFSYKSALGDYVGQLKKMREKDNIVFMGDFDNQRIGDVFSEIDVLVVPSIWYENSPLVIQEALLTGTPVIASRIGGIPELIKEGENGFLFEPGNEQDLKEIMQRIIDDPGILNGLKIDSQSIATIEENAKEVANLYGKLISVRTHNFSDTLSL